MKKLFICLANSKKYGEKCVAGIEVEASENGNYNIVSKDKKPRWIRPITNNTHGAIPENVVKEMRLLDVYEIEITEEFPQGYQSENVKFNLSSLKKVSGIGCNTENLDLLSETERNTIFLNRGKAIPSEKIGEIDHSLVLIKGENPEIYLNTQYDRKQLRIKFDYKSVSYDLPITDTKFKSEYSSKNNFMEDVKEVYITVSLGVEYEEWHYKLAAGIICVR